MVDIQRASGDVAEYLKVNYHICAILAYSCFPLLNCCFGSHFYEIKKYTCLQFYNTFCSNLEDIIWKPPTESMKTRITKSKSKKR